MLKSQNRDTGGSKDDIINRLLGNEPSMPPEGGLKSKDRELLFEQLYKSDLRYKTAQDVYSRHPYKRWPWYRFKVKHVLSGRWKKDEKTISNHNWKTLRNIESHRDDIIYFDPSEFDEDQVHVMTVDTVDFTCEEQRSDPMGKMERWFDHKSHSAGVEYEFALPLCLGRVSYSYAWENTATISTVAHLLFISSQPASGRTAHILPETKKLLTMGVCSEEVSLISRKVSGIEVVCIFKFRPQKSHWRFSLRRNARQMHNLLARSQQSDTRPYQLGGSSPGTLSRALERV
jgi:hypothetical protein